MEKLENELFISSNHFSLPVLQVDSLEVTRHPEEATSMKRQTVASYFRVWSHLSLCSAYFYKGVANSSHERPRYYSHLNNNKAQEAVKKGRGCGRRKITAGSISLSTVSQKDQMKNPRVYRGSSQTLPCSPVH